MRVDANLRILRQSAGELHLSANHSTRLCKHDAHTGDQLAPVDFDAVLYLNAVMLYARNSKRFDLPFIRPEPYSSRRQAGKTKLPIRLDLPDLKTAPHLSLLRHLKDFSRE